jgi:hypothetical protein
LTASQRAAAQQFAMAAVERQRAQREVENAEARMKQAQPSIPVHQPITMGTNTGALVTIVSAGPDPYGIYEHVISQIVNS